MRTKLIAMFSVLALALGVGGAFADTENGSTEHELDEGGNTVYTNDVECGEIDGDDGDVPDVDTPLANVYTTGNPESASGGVEVCNDGSDTPEEVPEEAPSVEGRIYADGSAEEGGTVAADGDKDNEPEQLQGWIAVDVNPQGEEPVSVTCGADEADGGNLSSTHRTEADSQGECGEDPPEEPPA